MMVGSKRVDSAEVGFGSLRNVSTEEAETSEQISYSLSDIGLCGGDLLVRKGGGRYTFRLVYPKCPWVSASDLPPLYARVALGWLKLRRRGKV